MNSRPTLSDIAARAGVTVSCVSQALRGLPSISKTRIDEVRRIAREIGYRPDPALAALAAYRSAQRPAGFRSVLAFVTDGAASRPHFLEPATHRAAELGYGSEEFHVANPAKDWSPLLQVLRNRGIRGILIASRRRYDEAFPKADLSAFTLATIGFSVQLPGIARVSTDQFTDMIRHREALARLGYRRPGLVLSREADARVGYKFSGGFLACAQTSSPSPPPILFDASPDALRDWVSAERVDCVLGAPDHLRLLKFAGFRIPQKLGFSTYDWHGGPAVKNMSGMDYRPARIVQHAVDLLHRLLLGGATGCLADPPLTLFSASFVRSRTTKASAKPGPGTADS